VGNARFEPLLLCVTRYTATRPVYACLYVYSVCLSVRLYMCAQNAAVIAVGTLLLRSANPTPVNPDTCKL